MWTEGENAEKFSSLKKCVVMALVLMIDFSLNLFKPRLLC